MSAAPTHLAKLDRVQRTAEKICNCNFESLESRREAAVFSIIYKLLDEECVEPRGHSRQMRARIASGLQ